MIIIALKDVCSWDIQCGSVDRSLQHQYTLYGKDTLVYVYILYERHFLYEVMFSIFNHV